MAVAVGALLLVASVLPVAASPAQAASEDEAPVTVTPSLQVSPELPEVRPGVPVELTAQLSHTVATDTPVEFQFEPVGRRPDRFGRLPSPPPNQTCVVRAATLSCSLRLVSHVAEAMVVRAWLAAEDSPPPDHREGRLSSLALYPHPSADCRFEDGEPLDDSCRGGLNSHVEQGRPEPDETDVVLVGWTGVADAFLDCDDPGPADQTELEVRPPSDRTVTYHCQVLNRATGKPIVGATLGGEILGGPFDAERGGKYAADYGDYGDERNLCRSTAPDGHCSFDLTVPGEGTGELSLCVWSDGDHDGFFGPDEVDGGDCYNERVDEPEGTDGTDVVVIRIE